MNNRELRYNVNEILSIVALKMLQQLIMNVKKSHYLLSAGNFDDKMTSFSLVHGSSWCLYMPR